MTQEEEKKMDDLIAQQAAKKLRQHQAWLKWYRSPKGQAYALKRKIKGATSDETS
jgi:hypothetical protein